MQGNITFKLGGVDRHCKVTLGLVPDIEAATGEGLMTLAWQAKQFRLKLTHAADIIGVALTASGAPRARSDVLEMMQHEGPVPSIETALRILNEFFKTPEGVAVAKPGNGTGRKPRTSH